MDKLMKALEAYFRGHIPKSMGNKSTIVAKEDKEGNVSIVFFFNKQELGRTKPRQKQEVEDYLTYVLYESENEESMVGYTSLLFFIVLVVETSTVLTIDENGLFDLDTGGYYPAMMLDEMFEEIHEALNG